MGDIVETLDATPKATQNLRIQFIQNSWLSPNVKNPTADDLVTVVLNRIKDDANQYVEFRDMLSDMEGMDLLLKKIPQIDCEKCACFINGVQKQSMNEERGLYIIILFICLQ